MNLKTAHLFLYIVAT